MGELISSLESNARVESKSAVCTSLGASAGVGFGTDFECCIAACSLSRLLFTPHTDGEDDDAGAGAGADARVARCGCCN